MFLATIKKSNGTIETFLYESNANGYRAFFADSFNPLYEILNTLELCVRGKTYAEKKNCFYDIAVLYSNMQGEFYSLSWGEHAKITNFFERNAKRYGLVKELQENAII